MNNRQDNISGSVSDDGSIAILTELQAGLKICRSPYRVLADKLGITLGELLAVVRKCFDSNVLREISPVFNASGLGYKSTLVAANVPQKSLAGFVEYLNSLPGVSHNYGRENHFNIWFTLALPDNVIDSGVDVFTDILARMEAEFGLGQIVSLPALKMYKLKVQFGNSGDSDSVIEVARGHGVSQPVSQKLNQLEIRVIRELQNGIPLCEYPFAVIAEQINSVEPKCQITEDEIISLLEKWYSLGVLRRIAGRVRHYNLGYKYNAMLALDMSGLDIDLAGRAIAASGFVSHCYRRQRSPLWQYDLYAMVHSETQQELDSYISDILGKACPRSYSILPTTCEYKKQAVRYFV